MEEQWNAEKQRRTVAVIDGNSLMHRAYHAVPPTMNAPDGTPTNAVFGFLSMFFKFVDTVHPDAVVCAFDAGKPAFRIELMEQYKAQRPPMDQELRVQFPLIESLLAALHIPVVKVPGWEGDDILGTIAARNEANGDYTLLVTGDKDACQLASDLTHIVTTKKGITDVDIMDPQHVFEKYGVTPEQFPDFLGLMGDSSDNIPGVPGIGAKTAAKYMQSYGSIEGLYDHLDELKGKTLEKVRDNKDLAFLSRKIATIVRDLDFPLNLEQALWPSYTAQEAEAAFGTLAMKAHLGKALSFIDASPIAALPAELNWEAEAGGLDLDGLVGIACFEPLQSSLFEPDLTIAISQENGTLLFYDDEARNVLARIVREGSFAAYDVKSLLHHVHPRDTAEDSLASDDELLSIRAFDVGLAAYVLDSNTGDASLGDIMETYRLGSLPQADTDDDCARIEACAVRMLAVRLEEELKRDGTLDCFSRIDTPLVPVLAMLERTGAAIDTAKLAELGSATQEEIDTLSQRIFALTGHEFNIDSPKQLSSVLFEEIGLKPIKKNQRGYSTDAGVLKELSKSHDLPREILKYRELAKIKSTYIDALPPLRASGDRRIHSSFNEKVTTTGRLSSSDPNLQNIPVRTGFGRKIRECFVPLHEGELFVSADYSQIELRLLAHLSQDAGLIGAFGSGKDFHAETAARVFGVSPEEVTPELRSRAKAVNFGIVYGQQAFGLSQSLDIPFADARDMIDAYFAAYPDVRRFLDETVRRAKYDGYAVTMFGRKRHIAELRSGNANLRNFGERTAMNHPMQGSAADIIKMAMRRCSERLVEEGFKSKLLLQVHDELDFSVPVAELEALTSMVRDVMEHVVELDVPLFVDVSWGSTWAEAH